MSWLLASDSQSIVASASISVLPMNIHLRSLFYCERRLHWALIETEIFLKEIMTGFSPR